DPRVSRLTLLAEVIRREGHFLARRPSSLFQCVWNLGWWYDAPNCEKHYESCAPPPIQSNAHLADLLVHWRREKEFETPEFYWLRALRPPAVALGQGQVAAFEGHDSCVNQILFVPRREQLLSVSGDDFDLSDCSARMWDLSTGAQAAESISHPDA